MSASLQQDWTQDAFFAWAEAQEERYEFDGHGPVLMTGGTINHSLIHGNITFALRLMLRESGYLTLGADAGIATVGKTVRYPDVLITGVRPAGSARLIPDPLVVVEVISPTSGKTDRITKVREYAAVPSIRCYVIVESAAIGLTVLTRTPGGWFTATLAEGDALTLDTPPATLPVSTIYEGVDFTT